MMFFSLKSAMNTWPYISCVSRQHFLLVADISSAQVDSHGNGNGSSRHVIAAASRVLDDYGVQVSKDEQDLSKHFFGNAMEYLVG